MTKILNVDSFWNLIEINENNFLKFESILFKQYKNFIKITNTIVKTRSSTLITKFIKHSRYRKKITRKKFKNFKNLSFMNFEIFENNLIEKFLNMIFINVVIFRNLLNSRKRKNNYKIFFFFMKKIDEILKSLEIYYMIKSTSISRRFLFLIKITSTFSLFVVDSFFWY